MAVVFVYHTWMLGLGDSGAQLSPGQDQVSGFSCLIWSRGEKSPPFRSCSRALALSSSLGLKARSGKWFVLFHNITRILLYKNVEYFSLDYYSTLMYHPPVQLCFDKLTYSFLLSFLPYFFLSSSFLDIKDVSECVCVHFYEITVLMTKMYRSIHHSWVLSQLLS